MIPSVHRQEWYDIYTKPESKALCVFVHGYGGSHSSKHWGNVPELISYDPELNNVDFCFWGYTTSRSFFANFYPFMNKSKKLSSLDLISYNLCSHLETIFCQNQYQTILLIGHSMGGLISCLAATKLIESRSEVNIDRILLYATPMSAPEVAVVGSRFAPFNPHLRLLGNSKKIHNIMKVKVPIIQRNSCPIDYIFCCADEVLEYDEGVEFKSRKHINARHSWMQDSCDYSTEAYIALKNWVVMAAKDYRQ
ncbi:MAG: esterase/lipase family protein [Rhodospirillaceae bacterium]